jgi:hypothetical protein
VSTKQTLWYYHSLADIFGERLSNQLSDDLREIVEILEAEVSNPSGERLDVGASADSGLLQSNASSTVFVSTGGPGVVGPTLRFGQDASHLSKQACSNTE